MGITNNIKRLVTPGLKPVLSQSGKIVDTYTHYFKTETIEKNTFFYESRDGQSMTDSPLAIFEYLYQKDVEKNYQHIWSYVASKEMDTIRRNYQDASNITFVERDSDAYLKWLNKAEYLINNATFQAYVTIKPEQTYINTWHGTPLKTMGFDIPGNPSGSQNVVRNFYMADYLLSPNAHTSKMFLDSFRLRDGFEGEILESGYPRIDQTFATNHDAILKQLFQFKLSIDLGKKIMLYTPTWKGSSTANARNDVEQIHHEMARIREEMGDEYNILVKVHPFLYKKALEYAPLQPYLVPDSLDTNKILGLVDVLITDYSSIFFDYLVTNRPILFYCWDDDLYTTDRGQYFTYDELPGPVSFTIEHLIAELKDLEAVKTKSAANYQRFKAEFTNYDDGCSTERYLDYILERKHDEQMMTIIRRDTAKKKLLFYPGGMMNNGITSSLMNLIQNIDFSIYDVTCVIDRPRTKAQMDNINALPKETHLLFRFSHPNFEVKEAYRDLWITSRGVKNEEKYPQEIYERECLRLLGKQHFDVAIDFSGYSFYWAKFMLAAPTYRRLCFMHSDMAADRERVVNGRKIHKVNLTGLFSVYNKFDELVSVSEITRDTNREKLAKYAPTEKFVYTPNTINPERILGIVGTNSTQADSLKTIQQTREAQLLTSLSEEIELYTTRPDFDYTQKFNHQFYHPDLLTLGFVEIGDKTYYKISQDNQYIGWIDGEKLDVYDDRIISKEKVSYFGSIATRYNQDIFSAPLGLANSTSLGNARYLRNTYVKINQVITTNTTQSVPIVVKGQHVGWLALSSVRMSNRFNFTKQNARVPFKIRLARGVLTPLNRLKNHSELKKLKYQATEAVELNHFMKVVAPQEVIAHEELNSESPTVSLGVLPAVFVKYTRKNSQGNWWVLRKLDGRSVYVKREKLPLVDVIETEVAYQQAEHYEVNVLPEQLTIYASEEMLLKDEGTLVQKLETVEVVQSLITTDDVNYLQVKWGERLVWINEDQTEKSDASGVINHQGDFLAYPDPNELNFVTMGRLSQEKNQVMLVEAFAKFYRENKRGRLYIIGAGPEEETLRAKIAEENIKDEVVLVGQLANPFSYMKRCDIFILTSFYEGQPMVLLEAMTLDMNIISTDIPACRYVLEDGAYGYLAKTNDSDGIKAGMQLVSQPGTTFKEFKPYDYNQEAVAQFYTLLETTPEEVTL
ncbi:CDP-glycerol glycerophosphotransferase family protein [Vagococcus silagei]|uniref:Glycosyltransferase n=1 Tax=Vagococcus silagei TaxID=2508885 RepID=A0A4S3AZJ6_9ENTE|nr:CDP-glycerol glycerophosphotransferase family protein [Vagococcus silagei]THB60171.1 glycosyltransferase [Vagococcus silagei]